LINEDGAATFGFAGGVLAVVGVPGPVLLPQAVNNKDKNEASNSPTRGRRLIGVRVGDGMEIKPPFYRLNSLFVLKIQRESGQFQPWLS
jgi:hypothetical protein